MERSTSTPLDEKTAENFRAADQRTPSRFVIRTSSCAACGTGASLRPITGDLFLGSTRAPHELAVSARLREGGVATPQVLAYLRYHVAGGLRRVDVLTQEIPDAEDLLTALRYLEPGDDSTTDVGRGGRR